MSAGNSFKELWDFLNQPISLGGLFQERPKVPAEVIETHKRLTDRAKISAALADRADSSRFQGREFVILIARDRQLRAHPPLSRASLGLEHGINTYETYISIHQIEFKYQGSRQTLLYDAVGEILDEDPTPAEFQAELDYVVEEALSLGGSADGERALLIYYEKLLDVGKSQIGLDLLYRLNCYHNGGHERSLKIIAEMTKILMQGDLSTDRRTLALLVEPRYQRAARQASELLGIELPQFPSILHAVALRKKHRDTYRQYKRLIQALKTLRDDLAELVKLRKSYVKFDRPRGFAAELPGRDLMVKYREELESV